MNGDFQIKITKRYSTQCIFILSVVFYFQTDNFKHAFYTWFSFISLTPLYTILHKDPIPVLSELLLHMSGWRKTVISSIVELDQLAMCTLSVQFRSVRLFSQRGTECTVFFSLALATKRDGCFCFRKILLSLYNTIPRRYQNI